MGSRENILNAVKANQPTFIKPPATYVFSKEAGDVEQFQRVLESIGGTLHLVNKDEDLASKIQQLFPAADKIVSTIPSLGAYYVNDFRQIQPHNLQDVQVVILEASLGVAENGAVWLSEAECKLRVLPFISEHLVVVLSAGQIVPTMHHAYEKIGDAAYGFGVFIAGPSKTADIEQSLVLGAHGPKTMTVLLSD